MARPRKAQSQAQSQAQAQPNTNFVKALNPKDPETIRVGSEPEFSTQPKEENRVSALAVALYWYNRFYGRKDAKQLMIQYLELTDKSKESKIMSKVTEDEFIPTYSWLARLTLRGLKLTESEQAKLDTEINRLLDTVLNPQEKQESQTGAKRKVKEDTTNNRPNVQEIMRDRAREAGGELEGAMDDFHLAGSKANAQADAIGFLTKYNILPQHSSIVLDAWKKKLAEYEEVLKGKDAQLVEAYSHLTKTQVKNTIKFIEAMIGSINSYVNNKKASKAPRKRKAVSPEKQVVKLKYLKEFKDAQTKLNLVSVHPKQLLGASEAWVYDTAKRKLHHYMADDYAKTFSVKGNTLMGIDTVKSEIKTLRKPAEQLKEIMGSKPVARKYFKDIKAVATTPTGRFNADMVILKAW